MIKKINKTEEIERKLKRQHKIHYLDKPIHMKAILAMNEEMKKVRKNHKIKQHRSQYSAAITFFTT